jgi:hypothetical protein
MLSALKNYTIHFMVPRNIIIRQCACQDRRAASQGNDQHRRSATAPTGK